MGIYTRFIDHLESRFRGPLPGPRAQYAMAHLARLREIAPPAHAKIAAVLALFYPKDGEWRIVFIERQSHNPRDQHRGQISFPGGRHDESDGSLRATALREAEEEVGVDAGKVAVVGQLTELYIPVSNFVVHPFVGFYPATPSFRPQEEEVRSILETPLELLRDPRSRQVASLTITDNLTLNNVPYFNVHGKVVWGATAMILSELLEVIAGEK